MSVNTYRKKWKICAKFVRRFGWTKADTDDNGRETYFPPDGLPPSGITLDRRRGGTWERIDPKDNSELIEGDDEKLAAYLELLQPYVE